MATFRDVEKASERPIAVFNDDDTPADGFGVMATILGVPTTYFFHGDGATAEVFERIELHPGRVLRYAGDGLKGGTLIPTRGSAES